MAMQVQSGAVTPIPAPLTAVGSSVSRPSGWTTVLALFCACMLIFAATLRIAHSHTRAEQESGRCPICLALHAGIPTAPAPVQVILHATPGPIVTPAPKAPALVRVRTLADRAPPASV